MSISKPGLKKYLALLAAAVFITMAFANSQSHIFKELSLTQLEQKLEKLDSELKQLAHYSLRTGIGSIGYRSDEHNSPDQPEWVKIDFGQDYSLSEIVIVPSIWRDTESGFQADGFPQEFQIFCGRSGHTNETRIATFSAEDQLLPRIAPLVIPCSVTGSWIRIEATLLTPRAFDGKFDLELAEVMAFSGEQNVALRKPVHISSKGHSESGARRREFLVDGFVPYLMDAAQGRQSISAVGTVEEHATPSLTIDLGKSYNLNRIHIHSVDLSDTIPQSTPTDFGLPRHMILEGAHSPNFSDAVQLAEYRIESIFDAAPIIMLNIPSTGSRYVRLTALEPYMYTLDEKPGGRLGFAELEFFSDRDELGNLALGKKVSSDFEVDNTARTFSSITDGRNLYGTILPTRQWMSELARRHELETLRPHLARELNHRYARQKSNLRIMSWLAALLVAGIIITVLIERMIHMHQLTQTKERFAADLHDELGANLHTIGLLSDMADEARNDPNDLSLYLQRIRSVTERTGSAVRHIINMQEAKGLFTGLENDMHRAASRILASLEHDMIITGQEHLVLIPPRKQNDLFLFYKECLVNAHRHSGATHVLTRLTVDRREVVLSVEDNGRGLEKSDGTKIPLSLKRRAKLLGAKINVEHSGSGGSSISVKLKIRRFQFKKYRGLI